MKGWRKILIAAVIAAMLATMAGPASIVAKAAEAPVMPEELRIIEAEAFLNDKSLRSVELPEGLLEIRERAFAGSGLTSIALPDSLTYIADDALPAPETKLEVSANVGTYAHDWAVRNGYIRMTETPASSFVYSVVTRYGRTWVTITGYIGDQTDVVIPAQIEGQPVQEVGSNTFKDNANIVSVVIPEGVTQIDNNAFSQCAALTHVSLPESLTAILSNAFYKCPALKRIYIPDSVTRLDSAVFLDCTALESVRLPRSMRTIPSQSFLGCTALKSVELPEDLSEIGSMAFYSCPSLETMAFPDSLTTIGTSAFYNCSKLSCVEWSRGLASIGNKAFSGCAALTDIVLSDTLTSMGKNAFEQCKGLEYVRLSSGMEAVPEYAFCQCTALKRIDVPEGVRTIGDKAFLDCQALERLALPDSLESIGKYSLGDCGLTELELGSGLRTIDEYAVSSCYDLEEITIPASVQSIGKSAFSGFCGRMVFKGGVPEMDEVFSNVDNLLGIYPHDNAAWTEEARTDYGAGRIAWLPDDYMDVVDERPREATEALTIDESKNDDYCYAYGYCTKPTTSFLTEDGGGLARVEYTGERVVVEQYDESGAEIWKKTIPMELPKWGGFYAGQDYNFFVFGRNNPQEDRSAEVIRVVRYTKQWRRKDAASFCAGEMIWGIYSVFGIGSVSMAQSGDMLYIQTNCTLFDDGEGAHHESNLSLRVYVPAMAPLRFIQTSSSDRPNYDAVSHSFNQLVAIDGRDVIKLDHGDANPSRGLQLRRAAGSAGTLGQGIHAIVNVMPFPGSKGENYTGAAVGGLQVSAEGYLVAGNAIDMLKFGTDDTRNIFVTFTPKDDFTEAATQTRWITTDSDLKVDGMGVPKLVRLSDSRFLLLWQEIGNAVRVRYVFLNGKGEAVSRIYETSAARLSNCQPVVHGGLVTWYVTRNSTPVYYMIDPDHPETVRTRG